MQNLTTELKARLKGAKRIALLGIGSELRADDAAGMLVAKYVEKNAQRPTPHGLRKSLLRVFYGETAPENLTGEIIRYKPTHIIVVDSADLKERPGSVLLLESGDLDQGISFSTHKLPARVMMDYFVKSLKCRIIFIGIQPKSIVFGKAMSKEARASVKEVSNAIRSTITSKEK